MQKATSAITFPHIVSRLYLQFLHSLLSLHSLHTVQRPNHTSSIQSLTSRFKVHEMFQINQSNFLIFQSYLTFVQEEYRA